MNPAELAAAAPARRGRRSGVPLVPPLRPIWLAALAAVVTMVLLLAFQQVVRQAVLQGELRARSNALLSDATWRCNTLRGHSQRDACLAQLAAVPRDSALLWSLHAAAAASATPHRP